MLGSIIAPSNGAVVSTKKPLDALIEAAENGDAESQFRLGVKYDSSFDNIEQNDTEAFEWYFKAAQAGLAKAQNNLGAMYYKKGNYTEAAKWYQKAADQGEAISQRNIGFMFEKGRGVDRVDIATAKSYYEKAAAKNFSGAQFRLGMLYEYGKGVAKDLDKAVEYYLAAANKGDVLVKF
ncbi:hypothetical protein HDU99_002659 [Rhizoclosmatium hyalinum]|nr:hypothetical protein HDU99_002659 [Rhizoclosmatium hyalinum]